jgi:hypothetical protein
MRTGSGAPAAFDRPLGGTERANQALGRAEEIEVDKIGDGKSAEVRGLIDFEDCAFVLACAARLVCPANAERRHLRVEQPGSAVAAAGDHVDHPRAVPSGYRLPRVVRCARRPVALAQGALLSLTGGGAWRCGPAVTGPVRVQRRDHAAVVARYHAPCG